jgi:uncharacterized Zn-binding protein involved in type VI secretion
VKEITRIHLAKTPYEIEINAKKDLEKYLAEIEKNMQADADAMREIEARMVEILAERDVKSDGVVTADDVAAIKQTLGGSEEFAGDEVAPSKRPESVDSDKKLMRDLDNAWVGGGVVRVNGKPVQRKGDKLTCGDTSANGSSVVRCG